MRALMLVLGVGLCIGVVLLSMEPRAGQAPASSTPPDVLFGPQDADAGRDEAIWQLLDSMDSATSASELATAVERAKKFVATSPHLRLIDYPRIAGGMVEHCFHSAADAVMATAEDRFAKEDDVLPQIRWYRRQLRSQYWKR